MLKKKKKRLGRVDPVHGKHLHRKKARRWLQDTAKRKLADFSFFSRPPVPVSPG